MPLSSIPLTVPCMKPPASSTRLPRTARASGASAKSAQGVRHLSEVGFLHKTTRWQQKLFYKALAAAAVNIEVLLQMRF